MGIFFKSQVEIDITNGPQIDIFEHEAQSKLSDIINKPKASQRVFPLHNIYYKSDIKRNIKMALLGLLYKKTYITSSNI